jgi:hypothetical protein
LSQQAFGIYSSQSFKIGSSHGLGADRASVAGDFSGEKSYDAYGY